MQPISAQPAAFLNAFTQLPPDLEKLAASTLQPSETVLIRALSNQDEALIVTSVRVIILKGASKTQNKQAVGRYFPLDNILYLESRRSLFGGFIAFITNATAQESRPLFMSKCSFAVSYKNGKLQSDVHSYLQSILDHVFASKQQAVAQGSLTPITVAGVLPQRNEQFYFTVAATLFAERTYREFVGGSQGVSFRIMRGVYYRVGGMRGRSENKSVVEAADKGMLSLSNRRLVFIGSGRTIDVPYHLIAGITPFSNGLQINLSNKKPLQFETGEGVSGLMLQRLCTNAPP
jgi:hypothetical protein